MPLGKDDDASNDHSFIINTSQVIYSDLDSSKVPRLTFSLFLCVASGHHLNYHPLLVANCNWSIGLPAL